MSNVLIALILSVGAAVWIGSMFYKKTGGNSGSSFAAAAVAGVLIFLIMLSVLSLVG
ncbi:hypothetical protein KC960_00955 [Candidatus Saccharibacteria bacterium]|nr:hypothetical protein [Candidatus Saccharibacteria bacterium]